MCNETDAEKEDAAVWIITMDTHRKNALKVAILTTKDPKFNLEVIKGRFYLEYD